MNYALLSRSFLSSSSVLICLFFSFSLALVLRFLRPPYFFFILSSLAPPQNGDGAAPKLPASAAAVKSAAVLGPTGDSAAVLQGNYYGQAPFLITPCQGLRDYPTALDVTCLPVWTARWRRAPRRAWCPWRAP